MLRRNPDLLAAVVIALYLFLGASVPAAYQYSGFGRRADVGEEVGRIVKAEVRSILRELVLTVHP